MKRLFRVGRRDRLWPGNHRLRSIDSFAVFLTLPVWVGFCARRGDRDYEHTLADTCYGSDAGARDEHVYPVVYGHDADRKHTRRDGFKPLRPAGDARGWWFCRRDSCDWSGDIQQASARIVVILLQ